MTATDGRHGIFGMSRRTFIGASAGTAGAAMFGLRPGIAWAATGYADGDDAPRLHARDTEDKLRRLAEFRGSAVLMQFGAVWCPPCITAMEELPALRASLDDEYGPGSVVMIDALLQDFQGNPATIDDANAWSARFGHPADVVVHSDGVPFAEDPLNLAFAGYAELGPFGLAIPTWVGIGADGVIVGRFQGWDFEECRALAVAAIQQAPRNCTVPRSSRSRAHVEPAARPSNACDANRKPEQEPMPLR